MAEETEMTPITPEEGGAAPAPKLKPVIRKPLIRKPVIDGGAPAPAAQAPSAAVPPKVAAPAPAAPAAEPPKPAASSVAAQAVLRKTGIVAEGILTPAQMQAAKTKTSRISLESAIGVAPTMKSSAPMKTIKLRRPTDLPGMKPPEAAAPAAPAPVAPPPPQASVAAEAPAPAAPAAPAEKPADISTTVTQKKTIRLQRPGFKRPTVSGIRKPGDASSAAAPGAGDVADLDVADIPDLKPMPNAFAPAGGDSNTVADVPSWLKATTLVAGIAALIVVGFCTWTLFREAVGPAAGPNDLATFHSETDFRR